MKIDPIRRRNMRFKTAEFTGKPTHKQFAEKGLPTGPDGQPYLNTAIYVCAQMAGLAPIPGFSYGVTSSQFSSVAQRAQEGYVQNETDKARLAAADAKRDRREAKLSALYEKQEQKQLVNLLADHLFSSLT